MDKFDVDHAGRCLRWYEWLVCLVLLALAAGVKAAAPVYRCIDAGGAVAFRDQPCVGIERESVVAIAAAPAYAAPPQYAVPTPERASRYPRARRSQSVAEPASSFECRAADGQVFYRHRGCPRTIAASDAGSRGTRHGKSTMAATTVAVRAMRIPREQACAQMRRAGALGRDGHAHDEDVSSYEKNLGRDLCH